MRTLHVIPVAVLTVLLAACASQKAPAEAAVQALDAAVAAARPDIERYAADRWPAVDAAATAVRTRLGAGDYAGVLADADAASLKVADATNAATAKKAALAAEWETFAGIPAQVQQVTQKVAELSASRRLPAGIDRGALDTARGTIGRITSMMAEASQAMANDDLATAVAKAKEIQALIEPLRARFGVPQPEVGR